jgi:hypothetical protein
MGGVSEAYWTFRTLRRIGEGVLGVYPACFLKSAEVDWNVEDRGILILGVCKRSGVLRIRVRLFLIFVRGGGVC